MSALMQRLIHLFALLVAAGTVTALALRWITVPQWLEMPALLIELAPWWIMLGPVCVAIILPMRRWMRALLIVILGVSITFLLDWHWGGCVASAESVPALRAASYNMGGGPVDVLEVMLWYENEGLDLLFTQESDVQTLRRSASQFGLSTVCHSRLCIVTQHDAEVSTTKDRRWSSYAAAYKFCMHGECWPLVNVHLDTPRHALDEWLGKGSPARIRQYLESRELESTVASLLADNPHVVIAGDFNMTQSSVLYRRYWQRWANAFAVAGCGAGATKVSRLLAVRIDHILYGGAWLAQSAWTREGFGGDHLPVRADLENRKNQVGR